MAQRLVLSTLGIKSPLDVGEDQRRDDELTSEPGIRPHSPTPPRRAPPLMEVSAARPAEALFYGTGRPLQTSIALDHDSASLLEELARAADVSVNALAVAALHVGLPASAEQGRVAIVEERVARAGGSAARIERNLRLPGHLRVRIDELTAAVRGKVPRSSRADLINVALRAGLPADAELAAELAADHARRVERASADL